MKRPISLLFSVFLLTAILMGGGLDLVTRAANAGKADVLKVKVVKLEPSVYRFTVTVRHKDQGWDHYCNRWEVLDSNGGIIGTRELMHPHDNEQPFTRSGTITIPMTIQKVRVRAHDIKDGYGGREMEVDLSL